PPVDPLGSSPPVRRPAEVARVHVRGQPLLESVELVRPHEVHLPAEARPVALEPEVVGERRDRGRELGRVVVDAGTGREHPGHQGRTPRRAERARRVGVLEHDSGLGQAVDRRRHRTRVPVRPQERCRELIHDEEEDVRPAAHGAFDATSLTACTGLPPSRTARTASAARSTASSEARSLYPPAWGLTTSRGADGAGAPSVGGSTSSTSRAAPPRWPACSASSSAFVSTSGPRETLTTTAPTGSSASSSAPMSPRVA